MLTGRLTSVADIRGDDLLPDNAAQAAAPDHFENASEAFRCCIRECIQGVVIKQYSPPLSVPKSFLHGFLYKDGKFSIAETTKTGVAVGMGIGSSLFSLQPAKDAVSYLAQLITDNPNATFDGEAAVQLISQIMNVTRTGLFAAFTTTRMLHRYLDKTSTAESFLKIAKPLAPNELPPEKFWYNKLSDVVELGGRGAFDLCAATASNFSILFYMWNINKALGFISFFATLPNLWFGMNNTQIFPDTPHPARRVLVEYMREQMASFLMLTRAEQDVIIDDIKELELCEDEFKERKIFEALLNLTRPDLNVMQAEDIIRVLKLHKTALAKQATSYVTAGFGSFSQVQFAEASGVGVANVFANPNSPIAIALGTLSALIALMPTVGFGYKGGKKCGEQLFVDHPSLGKILNPHLREALKWVTLFLNLFAGGTSLAFAYTASRDFANLFKLEGEGRRIFQLTYMAGAYTGSTISVGQYLVDALDELMVFIARRHADEKDRRLIDFVVGYQHLTRVLDTMNEENFLDISANWMLHGRTGLSRTLHAIYSLEQDDTEYLRTQYALSKAYNHAHGIKNVYSKVLFPRLHTDQYIAMHSFVNERSGLRRRNIHRIESEDIESQFARAFEL